MLNVTQALQQRRSIRAYRPDPVPDALIRELIELAARAPSNCNIQPWHIAVASGDSVRRLRSALQQYLQSGAAPTPGFAAATTQLQAHHRERQVDCAQRYYQALGIERSDRAARQGVAQRNWAFFDAPHVAFISMPSTMNQSNALDVGMFVQSLMLLMTERGLGSIAQGALAQYPQPIFAALDIPEGNAILCGLSFGYPKAQAQINALHMPRAELDQYCSFAS